jgi:hypothetical protein
MDTTGQIGVTDIEGGSTQEAIELQTNMVKAYSLRRILFSLITIELLVNVFFLFLVGSINIIAMLLVLIGWYGVIHYSSCASISYMVYLTLSLISKTYILFTFQQSLLGIVFLALYIILYIWEFELMCKFYNAVNKLTPEIIAYLKNPTETIQTHHMWY